MAQVVIFAPPGEDVSAGKAALEEAGMDVEVVEATPENLLHMAIGMLEGGEKDEEPAEEPAPEEEPPVEEEPAEEPAPEEEVTEQVADIDGEQVPVSIGTAGKFSLLRVLDLQDGDKVAYKINESSFAFWKPSSGERTQRIGIKLNESDDTLLVKVVAGSKPALVLTAADAKRFGLR